MGGGTLYDVTKHRGHQSSAMAESYAHLSADHMRKVAELTIPFLSRVCHAGGPRLPQRTPQMAANSLRLL